MQTFGVQVALILILMKLHTAAEFWTPMQISHSGLFHTGCVQFCEGASKLDGAITHTHPRIVSSRLQNSKASSYWRVKPVNEPLRLCSDRDPLTRPCLERLCIVMLAPGLLQRSASVAGSRMEGATISSSQSSGHSV